MSDADADKWDRRYRDGAYATRTHPSAFVRECVPRLDTESACPRALDIASGAGRNALYLRRLGWQVDALDISQAALDRLRASAQDTPADAERSITCMQADLETPSALSAVLSANNRYDLAIMIRYTNLPLIASVMPLLKPGGYLIVELHMHKDADVVGPRNPRFRVAPGALRAAAAGLAVVEYREGLVEEPDGRIAALAQLLAMRKSHRSL